MFFVCFSYGNEKIDVFFYVDDVLSPLPQPILEKIQTLPKEQIDQVIIKELIRTGQYNDIKTKEYGTYLTILSKKIQKIKKIILHGVKQDVSYTIQNLVDLEIDTPYTDEKIQRLKRKVEFALKNLGYQNAQIVNIITETTKDGFILIHFYIDSGTECVIQEIVMPTAYLEFLKFFDFPMDIGSPCDIGQVKDALQQIQEKYWSEGYLQAVVAIDHIDYTQNREKASIYIKIDIGKKTILQIKDNSLNIFRTDFLDPKSGGLTYSDLISLSDSDIRNAIIIFYQKQGYASVRVSPLKRYLDKDGNHIVSLDVVKGAPSEINQVFFLGDPLPVSKDHIQRELGLRQGVIFNRDRLEEYKENFKKILFSYGYNEAVVYDFDFYFSADKSLVNIIIRYDRNTQFIVSSIKYTGLPNSLKISQNKYDYLLKPTDPLDIEKRDAIKAQIHDFLLSEGYLYAKVKSKSLFTKTDPPAVQTGVDVEFEIISGSLVTIQNIEVDGDTFDKAETIRSISYLRTGDVFVQKKLDDAVKEILKHVLFTSVAIDFKDPRTMEKELPQVDLVIKVRGRKGFNFSLAPAYGTGTGYRVNANFNVNNLTSHGLRLTLNASVRQEVQQQDADLSSSKQLLGQSYTVGLTEPLFKLFSVQTPIDVSLLGSYQVVAESLLNRRIMAFDLLGEWKPTIWGANTNWSLLLDQNQFVSLSPPNNAVAVFDNPNLLMRDITTKLSIDTRNNIGWPTKGFFLKGLFGLGTFGFGSQIQFNNFLVNLKGYFPIYKNLSGGVYFGLSETNAVKNKSNKTVTAPQSLRTFLLDDSLVRGFPDSYLQTQAGPLLWLHLDPLNSSGQCSTQLQLVGGSKLVYLKAEGRYRINENFGLVAFADSGTVYFTQREMNKINSALENLTQISSSGQCVFDQASLVPTPPINNLNNIFKQYWDKTYLSTGAGVRVILGSYLTVNLDYGYPLRDPAQNYQSGCMTISEASNSNTPPPCVIRIQESTLIFKLKYRGAVYFTVEATL